MVLCLHLKIVSFGWGTCLIQSELIKNLHCLHLRRTNTITFRSDKTSGTISRLPDERELSRSGQEQASETGPAEIAFLSASMYDIAPKAQFDLSRSLHVHAKFSINITLLVLPPLAPHKGAALEPQHSQRCRQIISIHLCVHARLDGGSLELEP